LTWTERQWGKERPRESERDSGVVRNKEDIQEFDGKEIINEQAGLDVLYKMTAQAEEGRGDWRRTVEGWRREKKKRMRAPGSAVYTVARGWEG